MIDTQGLIHTIAGGGTATTISAGMRAKDAALSSPTSVAVTNSNTLYFINYGSTQVLEMKEGTDGEWTITPLFGTITKGDCGSTRQTGVTQASVGAVFTEQNATQLSDTLYRLFTSRDLYESYKIKGLSRVKEHFTNQVIAARLCDLIFEQMQGQRVP